MCGRPRYRHTDRPTYGNKYALPLRSGNWGIRIHVNEKISPLKCYYAFFLVCCGCDAYPVSNLHIYTFVVSRVFMAGADSQAGDADSSQAPGLTSGFQGSVNVHCGALYWCHSDSASVLLYFTSFIFNIISIVEGGLALI